MCPTDAALGLNAQALHDFHAEHYVPGKMVLAGVQGPFVLATWVHASGSMHHCWWLGQGWPHLNAPVAKLGHAAGRGPLRLL